MEKYSILGEENYLLNEIYISEFRIELLNHFSKKELKLPILIKEITFEITNENNLTIWYKFDKNRWIYIISAEWSKDSEF